MKKKLVSILLSLSMCAAYATPLTTVAAEEPAEAPTVVETAAPDAKAWSPSTTSKAVIEIKSISTTSVDVQYGTDIDLANYVSVTVTGAGITNTTNYNYSASIADSKGGKFISVDDANKKIKGLALTKSSVPVKISVSKDGQTSEAQLNVNVKQRNIEDFTVIYKKAEDNKKYKTLDEFISKYKGAKGLSVEASDVKLTKKDIGKINVRVMTGASKVANAENYTFGGGADDQLCNQVQISVEGKGNFTGKTDYDNTIGGVDTVNGNAALDPEVNLEPQVIYPTDESISGSSVTFGSVVSLLDGVYFDSDSPVYDASNVTQNAINASNVKNFKFKTTSKNIKVDAKGNVTVKKISSTAADNTVEVTISHKKNKKAEGKVKFNIVPMTISGASNVDVSKALKKTYKNLTNFEEKFIGKDKTKAKASGMVFKQKVNGKDTKLKAGGKDFNVTVTGMGIKGDGDAYFTDSNKTAISTGCQLIIEGKGNYAGTITCDPMTVKLEIQTVAVTGGGTSGPSVTFGDTETNVLDWIYVDKSNKSLKEDTTNQANILKGLKIAADKSLKIAKDGKITVKSVPDTHKAKVVVTAKKNKSSKDAVAEAEITVNPLDAATKADKFKLDASKFSSKTFKSKSAAEAAIKKVVVTYDGKKLKVNKDYNEPTVSITDNTTGQAIQVPVSVTLKGNYTGTVSDNVSITKSAN